MCGVAELGLHQRQVERPPHIDVRWERAGPLQKPEELVGLGNDVMDVGVQERELVMGLRDQSVRHQGCNCNKRAHCESAPSTTTRWTRSLR